MYIGNDLQVAESGNKIIDDISSSFNGSTTSFALLVGGAAPVPFPINTQQIYISVNGVIQEPDPTGSAGFKLLGNNIVFSSAPANGHAFFGVILSGADYVTVGTEFPAGSATAPSITFGTDNNTGLYSVTGGTMGFTSDGVQTFTLDGDGFKLPDNKKLLVGSSSDLEVFHDGSNSYIKDTGTGGLIIRSNDLNIEQADGGGKLIRATESSDVELYFNGTNRFQTTNTGTNVTGVHVDDGATHDGDVTFTGASASVTWDKSVDDLIFADNAKAAFGTSSDLTIYHSGSSSWVYDNGTGDLNIATNGSTINMAVGGSANEIAAKFISDGAVELYYDNVKKFETISSGVRLLGPEAGEVWAEFYADEGDDNADKWRMGASVNTDLFIQNYAGGSWETNIKAIGNGAVELYHDNSKTFETVSGGAKVTGDLIVSTGNSIYTGSSTGQLTIKGGATYPGGAIKFAGGQSGATDRGTTIFYNGEATSLEERMRLDSSGRLLLGTTTEGNESADDLTIATDANTGITIRSGANYNGSLFFSDTTSGADEYRGFVQYDQQNDNLKLGCATEAIVWLHADKKLSVGEDSTGYGQWFFSNRGSSGGDATGGDRGLVIYSDTGFTNNTVVGNDDWTLKLGNGAYAGTGVSGSQGTVVKLLFNGATSNGWNAYGALGLDVQGTSGGKGDLFFNTGGTTNGNTRLRISYEGKMIMGSGGVTTDTSERFFVDGSGANDHCGLGIKTNNATYDGFVAFHDTDANSQGAIRYTHSQDRMKFRTGGNNERICLDSDGLKFHGDTAAANALNDYEEGTYTPVVTFASTNNHTYGEQLGHYTKIGNLVTGTIVLTFDKQASSGHFRVSLPIVSSNSNGTRTSGYFTYQDGLDIPDDQGSKHCILYGGSNSTIIYAYFVGGTENSELGPGGTELTAAYMSSANTLRMAFTYRTDA